MTLPASYSYPLQNELPSGDEKDSANQLRKILSSHKNSGEPIKLSAQLDADSHAEVVLAPALAKFLINVLRIIGAGQAVTLVPVTQQLSTKQAADILNVSRPFLIKLLDAEEISHHMVGRHRRIDAKDIFAYRERMRSKKEKALDEIASIDSKYM